MQRTLPLLLILGLLLVFRILGAAFPETMPNFQPLAALFFCGALMAGGWRGFILPLAVWIISYPLPGLFQSGPVSDPLVFGCTLLAFGLTFSIGKSLASRGLPTVLLGSLTAALSFHLLTNGAAWLFDPRYAKTLGGLLQSLWTGAAGAPVPSWVFLRNFAAANLLFTGIFLSARICLPRFVGSSAATSAPAH
ncbi:MAG: hypothetical protein DVB26_03325 [Verrucomicrobia bacterium]|nr:MAG: hypothetical protein DVB26_03325 [Verrucomicrobiota bacterium]